MKNFEITDITSERKEQAVCILENGLIHAVLLAALTSSYFFSRINNEMVIGTLVQPLNLSRKHQTSKLRSYQGKLSNLTATGGEQVMKEKLAMKDVIP